MLVGKSGSNSFNNFWIDRVGLAVSTNDGIKDCLLHLTMQGVRIDTRAFCWNHCGSERHGQILVTRKDTMNCQFLVVVLVMVKVDRMYTIMGHDVVFTGTGG